MLANSMGICCKLRTSRPPTRRTDEVLERTVFLRRPTCDLPKQRPDASPVECHFVTYIYGHTHRRAIPLAVAKHRIEELLRCGSYAKVAPQRSLGRSDRVAQLSMTRGGTSSGFLACLDVAPVRRDDATDCVGYGS